LGWTDSDSGSDVGASYRFTNFPEIEKWWKIIFCVYVMISLNSQALGLLDQSHSTDSEVKNTTADFSSHQRWN
jgi:hypothetical protein